MDSSLWVTIVLLLLILLVVVVVVRAIQVVPQSRALVVERLGKFHSVMYAGLHLLIPFVDRVAARVDLREQVTTFQPQRAFWARCSSMRQIALKHLRWSVR